MHLKKVIASAIIILLIIIVSSYVKAEEYNTGNSAAPAADTSPEYRPVSIHDPSIFQDPISGNYYMYGTHITAARSKDLKYWESIADGYAVSNPLFEHHYLIEFADIYQWLGKDVKEGIWALDVIYSNKAADAGEDPYFMYVTVVDGTYKSAICLATSSKPEGPFKYKGKIVCSDFTRDDVKYTNMFDVFGIKKVKELPEELQNYYFKPDSSGETSHNWYRVHLPDCIDPAAYYDGDGNMYMLYGSFSTQGGLRVLKLNPVTGLRSEDNYKYIKDGTSDPYFGKKVANNYGEGGFILPVKSDLSSTGYYYYLFYSTGGLQAMRGYNMRMFRSEYPDYGFADEAGNSSLTTEVSGSNLGVRIMDNYRFSYMKYCSSSNGGNSALVAQDGKIFLAYHSKSNDGTEGFIAKINQMFLNKNGWLVTSPFTYSGETMNPITPDEVAGSYEFIYHRLEILSNPPDYTQYYLKSISLDLKKDQTVSGAYTGTWYLKGNDLTLKINGQEYQCKVFRTKDEDTPRKDRVVFTGCGPDNRCVWGASYVKTDEESVAFDVKNLELSTTMRHLVNFDLPVIGTFGSKIKWTSNNKAIKIDGGKAILTRGEKDTTVRLTAVVSKGKYSKKVSYEVIVGKRLKK